MREVSNALKESERKASPLEVLPASAAGCSHCRESLSEMPRDWLSIEVAIDVPKHQMQSKEKVVGKHAQTCATSGERTSA